MLSNGWSCNKSGSETQNLFKLIIKKQLIFFFLYLSSPSRVTSPLSFCLSICDITQLSRPNRLREAQKSQEPLHVC